MAEYSLYASFDGSLALPGKKMAEFVRRRVFDPNVFELESSVATSKLFEMAGVSVNSCVLELFRYD